ncbi:MAG: HAD-IC family P-type ATPase, partial [Candidatus Nanoperiomorbaceae bacterium]
MNMKLTGLTSDQVREQIVAGRTNSTPDKSSRTVGSILSENIFTRFNLILTILAVAVLAVGGGLLNNLFFLVMVINSVIGIVQELSAKRTLDRISILVSPRVSVIRDGKIQPILVRDVVLGDYIRVKLGDQIVADGEILSSDDLEIDESLLTGESDPVIKKAHEKVLSGSIAVAGAGVMRATAVGLDSYAAKLVAETKKFNHQDYSEIQKSINKIIKWLSWVLIVIAPLLITGQLMRTHTVWRDSVLRSIAAMSSMIPNGLVMVVSIAFVVAALRLTRKKVLVQRMPAVETLARVDTLLLDKTGTLTEGDIKFEA